MKEAKAKTFKNVYAKNVAAGVQRSRTHHLNDDAETEVDQSDVVDGLCQPLKPAVVLFLCSVLTGRIFGPRAPTSCQGFIFVYAIPIQFTMLFLVVWTNGLMESLCKVKVRSY